MTNKDTGYSKKCGGKRMDLLGNLAPAHKGLGLLATDLLGEEVCAALKKAKTARSPNHSRPLDRHRWSDHPEVHQLIDAIWNSYFSDFAPPAGRPGRRASGDPKRQLKVLILDLFVAWKADPNLSIGVSMSNRGYRAGSRYNALHISPIIIGLVHRAHDVGLIGLWRGNEVSGLTTRIWAAEPLEAMFRDARFGVADITHHQDRETIILNESEDRPLEYDDNADTVRMRASLTRYNQLLQATFVDIPTLEYPRVLRPARASNEKDTFVHIDQNNKFSRRIFYRGSWDLGGRIHGGFWQRMPEDVRAQLHLNDLPAVEDDYSGTHIALLYGMEGAQLVGDAYTLEIASRYSRKQLRDWVKILSLVTINADNEKSAFKAFRQKQLAGSPAKKFSDIELGELLTAFKLRHPPVASHLCTDKGVELMAIDGRITTSIIDQFTAIDVPVLTVFDSYIIDMYHADELRSAMLIAMDREVPGASTNIDREGTGADLSGRQGTINETLSDWRDVQFAAEKSEGYLARRSAFFEWRSTVPGYTREEVLDRTLATIRSFRQRLGDPSI